MSYRKNDMNGNQNKILKEFNKKFGCEINSEDVKIDHEDTVNFIFGGFRIMGMYSSKCVHFHFYAHKYICCNMIENIEDLGRLIYDYVDN